MKTDALALVGRLFLCAEFTIAALGKMFGWEGQAAYMAAHHLPLIPLLLGSALVIEVAGVLCLVTGAYARAAASVMALYLTVVSVLLHPFWTGGMNQTEFFKNLGMVGGLLMIAAFGPGRWSLTCVPFTGRRQGPRLE